MWIWDIQNRKIDLKYLKSRFGRSSDLGYNIHTIYETENLSPKSLHDLSHLNILNYNDNMKHWKKENQPIANQLDDTKVNLEF